LDEIEGSSKNNRQQGPLTAKNIFYDGSKKNMHIEVENGP
jgi:hypothetical protein